jgi:hypothetical protein
MLQKIFYGKRVVFFFFIIVLGNPLFPDDGNRLQFDGIFTMGSNSSIVYTEYFFIGAETDLSVDILKKVSASAEVELQKDDIDVEELFMEFNLPRKMFILMGKMENALTLDEFRPLRKRVLAEKSPLSLYLQEAGYTGGSFGFRVKREYDKGGLPISFNIDTLLSAKHIELQLNGGFFFHFCGDDSFLGTSVCYFPFFIEDFALNEPVDISHNFTTDIFFANFEHKFMWSLEFLAGKTLQDPLGLSTAGGDLSLFLGWDVHGGYEIDFNEIAWIPSVRYAQTAENFTLFKEHEIHTIIGNRIVIKKKLNIQLNCGFRFFETHRDIAWSALFFAEF